ncbi:hypothetical protein AMAG_15399 [Allomyces macrogynus ATCC 38327]|uniref:Uncharacterized protein n=1 Tax=Allomyces macrogynus (strain ATCC 38327) TaxID=578462 RepID=A0A0L0T759_ALLM3|nr:hypothetical protein AMAG_15399 [Allomyces macrogynus ATCC 38327]|eukprot:KNE70643.1 hypothetical protein AMAG_15399 [Allomyces macrogynus ATCC 38327]
MQTKKAAHCRSVRICLAPMGDKCRVLLAESPHWAAAKAYARATFDADQGFGIVMSLRTCEARWRAAVTEDEQGNSDSERENLVPLPSPSRGDPTKTDPPLAPPWAARRRSADLTVDVAPPPKRARPANAEPPPPRDLAPPSPPPPTAAGSSPWVALALGHVQMQTNMMHTEILRTWLAAWERMHALGYTKGEIGGALAADSAVEVTAVVPVG